MGAMGHYDDGQPVEWQAIEQAAKAYADRSPVVPECSLEYPCIDALSKIAAAPKYTFGSKSRKESEQDTSVPGPGSYFGNYDEQLRGKTAPKFSFGVATRHHVQKPRVPGPGEYVPRSYLKKGGFSLTPRRPDPEAGSKFHRTPGPGAHNVPTAFAFNGPRHTMTPRRNADELAETRMRPAPGPGQYEPANEVLSQTKPPKWGFGSSPRIAKLHDGSTPGPGSYRHEVNLNGKGPKYSMRARTANAKVGILLENDEEF